jgi:hypothetical protein
MQSCRGGLPLRHAIFNGHLLEWATPAFWRFDSGIRESNNMQTVLLFRCCTAR